MRAKLLSVAVMFIAVSCFTVFIYGTIGNQKETKYIHSIQCLDYPSESWGRITCENVTTKVERFQDGHVEITNVERTPIKPNEGDI